MVPMSYPPQNFYYQPVAQPKPPVRRRHPEAKLGPFTWMDLVTFVAYVLIMFIGVAVFVLFIPGVPELFGDNEEAMMFGVNFLGYAIMFALVLMAAGPELWRSFKTFRWYPWAKYLGLPGSWFVTIIASAIVVAVAATAMGIDPNTMAQSENQQAAQAMMDAIPFPLMALMVVVMGPLVEEYIFRQLLIGKLSRWINKWVLVVASAFLFMSLHFIGKEWPTFITGTPYVMMGLAFGIGYVLSGKSLGYSWSMHAFSNLMALSLSSLLEPMLPGSA